jgi:PAS domain S-box-containing protein
LLLPISSNNAAELSADTFQLLVESVEDYAIFMLDVDGHVLTWNRGAERIKGYSASEIIGRHFSLFYPREDAAAGRPETWLRVALRDGHVEQEGWRVRKDGSRFWANVVITALYDQQRRLRGFAKVTRDLSERRAAAEELRRSEERFRLLVESIGDYAVYMLDPTGLVTTWNTGAERIKGYAASEIIGRHYSAFFTPEDVEAGRPATELEVARASGRYEEEGWRLRKDGSRFWANVVLTSVHDSTGALVGFAKVTRDLTARKQAEETERELVRERAARAAAEEAEERVRAERERYKVLTDENARLYASEKKVREQLELIARAGETFSATLDYEETLKNVLDVVMPVLADYAFFDVVEGSEVRRLAAAYRDPSTDALVKQTRWTRPDRGDKNLCALSSGASGYHPQIDDAWRRDVAVNEAHLDLLRKLHLGSMITVPLRGRGQLLGALTLCFGRSARHHSREDLQLAEELARRAGVALVQARLFAEVRSAARAAEEASRVKDEFLATVSHELRTPLNAILGWSTLLRARSVDPSLSKGLDVIHRNADAQAKIIEDILDVSRIITGKLRLALEPTDLVNVTLDAIEVVRPSAAAKRISVNFVAPSEPRMLLADPSRLQQVVWNILSNAVKFTDEGGSIHIVLDGGSSHLHLRVIDSGRGIEPAFLPYVFDRFQQADASSTRRVGGLGLGLAIVRHIVELHGGQVAVVSEGLGKGATFSISLPIRVSALAANDEGSATLRLDEAAATESTPSLEALRILVVDDEPDARDLLHLVLEGAGAQVATAASAAEAFTMVQRFRPDVLVSDIAMPDEDGYGLMRRIRELDPAHGGGIPSIALTAYARADDKAKALSVGFTTHIGKPVKPEDLLATVANLAGRSLDASSS